MILNITAIDQLLREKKGYFAKFMAARVEEGKEMMLSFNASHNSMDITVICVWFQNEPSFEKPEV